MSESHWDTEKGAFKPEYEAYVKERDTFYATEQSRRLNLPKDPDGYKLEVRKDFALPQGVEFKLDELNPLLPQARQLMHDIDTGKVSGQEAFSRIIELHAAGEIGRIQNMQTAVDGEIKKLGATGTGRVTAVQNFLAAQLGEPMAKHMATMLVTAQHIEGFEKLMTAFRTQGSGTFTNQHREENQPGRKTDAEIAAMSFSERVAYAQQFPQPAAPAAHQANGR